MSVCVCMSDVYKSTFCLHLDPYAKHHFCFNVFVDVNSLKDKLLVVILYMLLFAWIGCILGLISTVVCFAVLFFFNFF